MAAKKILIKKYENRRLYDATNSRYVNLDEVAQFVQSGHEVQVIDVASGEDITRVILTQIIAEGAKTPDSAFPLDILRQMVMASGRASQESALLYSKAMMDFYQNAFRAVAPALNPFDFMRDPAPASPPRSTPPSEAPPPAPSANGAPAEDVNSLKERVAELEKLVTSLASAKRSKRKAARKSSTRKS